MTHIERLTLITEFKDRNDAIKYRDANPGTIVRVCGQRIQGFPFPEDISYAIYKQEIEIIDQAAANAGGTK